MIDENLEGEKSIKKEKFSLGISPTINALN